jgi:probable rRNA maturation factor
MISVNILGRLPVMITKTQLSRAVQSTFVVARRKPKGAISISFVKDKKIKDLNRKYRKINRPTDVLAFSTQDYHSNTHSNSPSERWRTLRVPPPYLPTGQAGEGGVRGGFGIDWGDVIIAPAYAKKEAKRLNIPFQEDLFRLVAHGTLHLLGYDHLKKTDEKRMFMLQEKVVMKARTFNVLCA